MMSNEKVETFNLVFHKSYNQQSGNYGWQSLIHWALLPFSHMVMWGHMANQKRCLSSSTKRMTNH